MLAELSNTIATLIGIFVALMGAFFFAFWVAMGIWTLNDIRSRTRDWLAIVLASLLVLNFFAFVSITSRFRAVYFLGFCKICSKKQFYDGLAWYTLIYLDMTK